MKHLRNVQEDVLHSHPVIVLLCCMVMLVLVNPLDQDENCFISCSFMKKCSTVNQCSTFVHITDHCGWGWSSVSGVCVPRVV